MIVEFTLNGAAANARVMGPASLLDVLRLDVFDRAMAGRACHPDPELARRTLPLVIRALSEPA